MALTQVTGPYPIFTDLDGTPLDDGYLYIGAINDDPETNPIQVFWDSNLTIPATQPIRTNNGYAWRNGTPGLLYTGGEFSITIRNKRNEFVLYSPVGYGFDPAAVSASVVKNDFVGDGVTVNYTLSASPSTQLATNIFINGVYQEKDSYTLAGNVITFSVAPPLSSSIEIMTNETGVINSGNATAISYTLTAPGAVQQTVQTKLDQYVSVKDFGAVGDGVTDDTAAIQAAVDSMTEGGILYFPTGKFRLTDEITIPPVGALILQGSGGNDSTFGSPVPSGDGTFIFQEANNKAVFFLGGGCSYTSIKDMTLSSTLTPGVSWTGTNKYGIKIEAALPNVLWSLTFSNLIFFNFERGISCVDPNAGSNPLGQDLSVAPVGINQCLFTYCRNGTYIDANNADYWVYRNCFFFVPSGGTGIYLRRFGMTFIEDCSAGGTGISNNRFIYVEGAGVGSIEKLLIAGCQSESVTQFLAVAATASYTNEFVIAIRDSVLELGSDIYLGKPVHLITENNRFSGASIYSDDAGNKFSTFTDFFEGGSEFYFLTGVFSSQFFETLWGPNPSPAYSNYVFNEGQLVNLIGSTSVPNVTATTLFTLPTTAGLYEIYAYLANGGSTYMRSARIGTDGTNVVLIGGEGGAGMVASVSGTNVQVTQNSGITQTINWGYRRIT